MQNMGLTHGRSNIIRFRLFFHTVGFSLVRALRAVWRHPDSAASAAAFHHDGGSI